jgi:xylulokinase
MAIYLGLDSSTQGLTATAIDIDGTRRRVLFERAVAFDQALPAYGTRRGVVAGEGPLERLAPPLMWAEALDLVLGEVAASGLDLASLRAISGSAQQHGSVYLVRGAGDRLARLDPGRPLAGQLSGIFSRERSPIWMDASTAAECAAITASVGGADALARLTGSRAFERFTGPQIRKFARTRPDAYARTERIHLVSSFMASLLAGRHAPIEPGDGSGMNLLDLARGQWAKEALEATADGLEAKLPPVAASWSVVGELAPYWQRRYGYPPARVIAWSGDNPCSLVGNGLVSEGRVAVSLGTSDTVFGFMPAPHADPSGTGHVFASPTGGFMGLTCFSNGSLARERVRDEHGLDWAGFSALLRATPPGNGGALMLPWFEPEITPPVLRPGVRRVGLDPRDAAANVRAVVEAQMMAMRRHSRWMGVEVEVIHATGGASANRDILQVMADVFGATVYRLAAGNSAALGAALRAYHGDALASGRPLDWREVVAGFADPDPETRVEPRAEHRVAYDALIERYARAEQDALAEGAGAG